MDKFLLVIMEIIQDIKNFAIKQGEPLQFGIKEDELEEFLRTFGFSNIHNINSEEYKKSIFPW